MIRTPFALKLVVSVLSLTGMSGELQAQAPGTIGHDHLSEVACVDVPPGEKRPSLAASTSARSTGLQFAHAFVYWHFREFRNRKVRKRPRVIPESWWRKTAERGFPNSGHATWLCGVVTPSLSSDRWSFPRQRATCGSLLRRHAAGRQFESAYAPGPGRLVRARGRAVPGDSAGRQRARAGHTMTVRPNIPMELNVTGTALRRAFALVIHDAAQQQGHSLRVETVRDMWPVTIVLTCAARSPRSFGLAPTRTLYPMARRPA